MGNGGPEGENYRKLPGLVKQPKTIKKSGGIFAQEEDMAGTIKM